MSEERERPLVPEGTLKTAGETPVTITLENGEIIEMIPNPLPVPKRKVRTGMDFPRVISEDMMEFDHDIPEDKLCFDVE